MHRFLILTSILCAAFALLSVVWILVPAPSYYIWLYAVAVSEWSLWLGALALVGIILALLDYAFYTPGKITLVALIFGAIAFLISLYPLFTAFQTARERMFRFHSPSISKACAAIRRNRHLKHTFIKKTAASN